MCSSIHRRGSESCEHNDLHVTSTAVALVSQVGYFRPVWRPPRLVVRGHSILELTVPLHAWRIVHTGEEDRAPNAVSFATLAAVEPRTHHTGTPFVRLRCSCMSKAKPRTISITPHHHRGACSRLILSASITQLAATSAFPDRYKLSVDSKHLIVEKRKLV